MVNLKDLQAFQGNLSQQRGVRSGRGEQSYQEGLQLLEQYNLQPDKEILLQAMHKFIECMTQQRQRVEPLVMLSYLYYALKSPQLSAKYYRLAAAIDAQAPDVKRLQAILTTQERIPTVAEGRQEADNAGSADPDLDYDAFYEEVEALIDAQLRALLRQSPSGLALDPESLERLNEVREALSDGFEDVRLQLEVVHAEIDTQELLHKLAPLERRLHHYDLLLQQSQQGSEILAKLHDALKLVEHELRQEPLRDTELDSLLDRCDALADQINALDTQGALVQELEASYRHLISVVTRFQDALEDLSD